MTNVPTAAAITPPAGTTSGGAKKTGKDVTMPASKAPPIARPAHSDPRHAGTTRTTTTTVTSPVSTAAATAVTPS